MENKREMTAPNVSVGADTEQPIQKCTDHSISDYDENIKSFEEMQREMPVSYTHLDVYKRQGSVTTKLVG